MVTWRIVCSRNVYMQMFLMCSGPNIAKLSVGPRKFSKLIIYHTSIFWRNYTGSTSHYTLIWSPNLINEVQIELFLVLFLYYPGYWQDCAATWQVDRGNWLECKFGSIRNVWIKMSILTISRRSAFRTLYRTIGHNLKKHAICNEHGIGYWLLSIKWKSSAFQAVTGIGMRIVSGGHAGSARQVRQ